MRVGIDGRPLQLDAYRERGIGSHLRGWIEAAQLLDTRFAISLLCDPSLPLPSVKLTSKQWQLQPLKLPFSPAPADSMALHLHPDEEFVFDSAVEAFLLEHEFDLFHATYPFMWEAFVSRRLHHVAWTVTIYDLIPLLFRGEYLDSLGERGAQSFAQRLGASVYARRVQTISVSSKNDVIKFTGVAPEKIDVVYGGVDESFLPLPKGEVERTISNLGISAPYIFGVSGFHHTKNLRRLLEAYSLLPETLRQQFHLVVLCPLSHQAREIVHGWLANLEIQDRVTFLQGVRQQQMVALYNGATVVVHPTLYEGLGLPILEAMRCGTPVVASNAASMPEIAGEAARLVDPYDPEDIARGMAQVLASPTLQTELRERGFQQAASFTWERTAVTVLESFVKAAETAQTRPPVASVNSFSRRFKISFWSPLNPRPSGVSDYSELLLAELGKCADVHLFLDGYQPSNLALFDLFPTFDSRAFPYISHRHSYDIILYQVGNNPLHRYMYRPILDWPGIVTFHDVCIYHFIHAVLALGGNPEEFWQEVAYSEGPEVVKKARVDYLKGTLDDYLLLLNKRLVTASRGVITHSEWAAKQLQKHNGTPPIRVIPHGMLFLEDEGMRFGRLVRQLLGLPEKGFVFGVFGNLHRVKRLPVVLRAFARVHKEYPETGLFIMGRVDPSAIGDIDPLQQDPQAARAQGIHLYLAYASYELMLMAMQAVNVAINLRYPTAGETSGSLSTLLGFGKPTIVSAVGSFTEYPDDCCPKIPIDDNEEDTLFRHMLGVVKDESHYRRAVRCAYEYSRNRTWSHCAQGYLDFIEEVLSDHHSSQ